METKFSAADLARRTIERRAVEAVLWGMPAVNFDLMYQAFANIKGGPNQIVYWSHPLDWKNQTLTPNPNTIYLMPFYDTTSGPVVPSYTDKPPPGCIVLQSDTYRGYAILRSNLEGEGEADIGKAVAYGKRVKFYPFADAGKSGDPQTRFVDAFGAMFDATIPYDIRFYESLARFVQAEPWLTRDKVMIDLLKPIGIEKGKRFAPDANVTALLEAAVREAHAWIDAQYEKVFVPPARRTRSSATCAGPAARPTRRGCEKTRTVPPTSSSDRRRRRDRNRTGFPPIRRARSRYFSGFTVPRSRCSTRHGGCPTSRSFDVDGRIATETDTGWCHDCATR